MTSREFGRWRKQRGLSQMQLAYLLKRGLSTVQAYEYGTRRIPAMLELALCEVDRIIERDGRPFDRRSPQTDRLLKRD